LNARGGEISRNSAASSGGGVYVVLGTATLSGTQVYSNVASDEGGGVYVAEGTATLSARDGEIQRNSATRGGGVYVNQGTATLSATQVYRNSVSDNGGGVYVLAGVARLDARGGEIHRNSASQGGGVYVYQGTATLSGTQVYSNAATWHGGGVYVNQGTATLSAAQVYSNSVSLFGGGVYVYQGTATLNATQVCGNAARDGGGLHVVSGEMTLDNTQVLGNSAFQGGGVYVNTDTATLDARGGAISRNSASDDGGGVFVVYGTVTLSGTQVSGNTASDDGGGVFLYQGTGRLNAAGGEIKRNFAVSDGGGVYVAFGTATLSGTQVYSNSASDDGGGMYVYQGTATLSGAQVYSNAASDQGGGVFVERGVARLEASAGAINHNFASFGGGVCVTFGTATLNGTQVYSNSASHEGGGVYLSQGTARLNAAGGAINRNSASDGGGVFVGQGTAMLSGTQVYGNSAFDYGGGVCVHDEAATLNAGGGEISHNSAFWGGGGVYVAAGMALLNGTQVYSNSASWDGGGVCVFDGTAVLNGTQVYDNSAYDGGGVLVFDGAATLSETHVYRNAAAYGGGLYVLWGRVTLSETHVYSNSAASGGGGVFVESGTATLSETHVYRNATAFSGGGVYVSAGGATLNAYSGEISHNSAFFSGGGVYVALGTATLSETHVLSNTATAGSGLYLEDSGALTATNGCLVNNSDFSAEEYTFSGGALVATGNWWGAANGPAGAGPGDGDSVSAGVDYAGFQTSAPPGCPTLRADLLIHKAVATPLTGPGPAALAVPGQAITYTLTFTNAGPHIARRVVVSDRVPVSVTVNSVVSSGVSVTPSVVGRLHAWRVAGWGLPQGGVGVITLTGVLSYPLSVGAFTNTAVITAGTTEVATTNNSAEALVMVQNVAPLADDDGFEVDEDSHGNALDVLDGDSDANGDALTVAAVGTPNQGGVASGDEVGVLYTPAPDFNGAEVFTYTVTDGHGGYDTASVTVMVRSFNDPPVADDDTFDVDEDSHDNGLDVLDGDSDVDGDTLTVYAVGMPNQGGAALDNDTHVLYTPAPDFDGTEVFTYTLSDGQGGYATASVSVTVNGINDAPLGVDDAYATPYETVLHVPAETGVLSNDQDVESGALTLILEGGLTASLVGGPYHGSLALNLDGSFVYTPTDGFSGDDIFTYVVSDGELNDTASVTLTVGASGNTAPTISDIVDQRVGMNAVLGPIPFTIGDVETDPGELALYAASSNPTLVLPANVGFGGSGANRSLTITPTTGISGTATITISVDDGELATYDTFVLTVEPLRVYLPLVLKN
jgi:uncharacterized repeat protein (TIGR01451 family)